MFGKVTSFGGLLLLAGGLALVTPDSAQAQHRGGGHFGGGHHGGFHGGGFHHGGFHHGGFHHRHFFPHHRSFHGFWGFWPGYYPYYSSYYPDSGYSGSYPYTYSSNWSSPAYDPGYYGDVTSSYPDSYFPSTAQPDTTAHITVSVPPGAEIWFDDHKTTAIGSVREFQSPPLTPGRRYAYEVRARWYENGQEVTQTQRVPVTSGAHVRVTFPVEPTKARTAPNH